MEGGSTPSWHVAGKGGQGRGPGVVSHLYTGASLPLPEGSVDGAGHEEGSKVMAGWRAAGEGTLPPSHGRAGLLSRVPRGPRPEAGWILTSDTQQRWPHSVH